MIVGAAQEPWLVGGRTPGVKLKQIPWEPRFSLALVLASAVLHLVHFAFFRDGHHLWLWGLTRLAFLPVSVLVVTVFVDRLLSLREKEMRLEKLNMLIGAFFSVARRATGEKDVSILRRRPCRCGAGLRLRCNGWA